MQTQAVPTSGDTLVRKKPRRDHRIAKAAPKGVGQPPYVPTEAHRELVKDMVIAGISIDAIGDVLGVSHQTVRNHFKPELNGAVNETIAKVARNVVQLSATHPLAAIYYLNNRAAKYGWQDRRNIQMVVEDRRPDFSRATPEQLEALERAAQVMAQLRDEPRVIEHQAADGGDDDGET